MLLLPAIPSTPSLPCPLRVPHCTIKVPLELLHKGRQQHTCSLPRHRRGFRWAPCLAAVASASDAGREVVVGIDLGTTNSAVACIKDGQPVCIANADGDTLTPSIVTFQPDGTTLVGRAAKQAQAKNPSTTFYSVKRLIGREWSSPAVQEEAQRLAYTVSFLLGNCQRGLALVGSSSIPRFESETRWHLGSLDCDYMSLWWWWWWWWWTA